MIIDFTVSSKKGDIQLTTWNIEQNACYNSIQQNYWRKEGKIKEEYTITLLINGSEENSYRNTAGIKGYYYNENNERIEFKNPSIVFRAQEMGSIVLNCHKHYNGEYNIYPSNGNFTAGEIEFLKSNVYPKILNHITSNKQALYEDARAISMWYMQKAMNEYKEAVIRLEDEMKEIIKTF